MNISEGPKGGADLIASATTEQMAELPLPYEFHHYVTENLDQILQAGSIVHLSYMWGYLRDDMGHSDIYDLELTLTQEMPVRAVLEAMVKLYLAAMVHGKSDPREAYGYEGISMKSAGQYRLGLGT